jgi:hypothetical protein
MADVTLYVRARMWLDDPKTKVPELDRHNLNALLAVSQAERETATEIRLFRNQLIDLLTEVVEPLVDLLKAAQDEPLPEPIVSAVSAATVASVR